ncbi:MAG: hypothetical protein JRC89_04370 [Deltaproteobacteria bacterium]|nr:hypothetical protein [Deltaproteobacteria bacterium]
MKNFHKLIEKLKDQRGAVSIFVAVAAVFFLIGIVSLAVDVGYLYATRNELQNIADAAALAATNELGNQQVNGTSLNETAIKNAATSVAAKNQAGGKGNIIILTADIIIGEWDQGADPKFDDTPESGKEDAVKVIARRESGANGPVSTFFAKILGHDTAPVNAYAIASLTGLGKMGPGGLPIPIGVSIDVFDGDFCDKPLIFHPTTESCAGWHTYELGPGDEFKQLKKLVEALKGDDPAFTSPETYPGVEYNFNGGTNDATYKVLDELFQERRFNNDGWVDRDTNDATWTTAIVVFDHPCYDNPNDTFSILGFAVIEIHGICYTGTAGQTFWNGTENVLCEESAEQIIGKLNCNYVEANRGGGLDAGITGSIAGLVAPPL